MWALAVDLVYNGIRNFFDVAIVASTDTDLAPALEAICELHRAWGKPRVEVASWSPTRKRLSVKGAKIWCHWLSNTEYRSVQDQTVYVPLDEEETQPT